MTDENPYSLGCFLVMLDDFLDVTLFKCGIVWNNSALVAGLSFTVSSGLTTVLKNLIVTLKN